MNVRDIADSIKSDAEAIQRATFDADMNKDDITTYLHTIDVLTDHILEQTQILATMPIKNQHGD